MESQGADKRDNTPLARRPSQAPQPSACARCCVNTTKTVMVTINICFLIFGCVLAGVSGWALANESALAQLIPRGGLFMVLGCAFVLAIVACLGVYGALDEHKGILTVYVIIALVTVAVEVAAGGVVFAFLSDLNDAKTSTSSSFQRRINTAINETFCDCCNITTVEYGCNEVGGHQTDSKLPLCKLVPSSFRQYGANCLDPSTYKAGIIDWINDNLKPIAIVCIVFVFPQVMVLFAACILMCRARMGTISINDDDEDRSLPPFDVKNEREKEVEYWPFCIVFPKKSENDTRRNGMMDIVTRLHRAGLKTCLYWSADKENIICKISATRARLEAEANRVNFNMRLHAKTLREHDIGQNKRTRKVAAKEGGREKVLPHASIELQNLRLGAKCECTDPSADDFYPYHYIHYQFDILPDARQRQLMTPDQVKLAEHRQKLYLIDRFTRMKFREIDILKLVFSIVEAPESGAHPRGAGIALEHLFRKKKITEYFPLHHPELNNRLKRKWYVWCNKPWAHPLQDIRAYFGEEIAMYFSFLGHYTQWLLAPAFVGVIVYVHQLAADDVSVPELPIFAIFIALWVTLMLEAWKRKQATNVMMWGMKGYEHNEATRPQYNEVAAEEPSPVTGLPARFYPRFYYRSKIVISTLLISVFIGIVVVCVGSIFLLRAILVKAQREGSIPDGTAGYIAAFVNAIQIHILNFIYAKVARLLNDWENHPTDTIYNDNLIAKTFLFQMVNSYFNLFYVAFIKNNVTLAGEKQTCKPNDQGVPDCLHDLSSQLGVIFVTRLVIGNIMEVVLPQLKHWWKMKRMDKTVKDRRSPAERENERLDYETFGDYSEVVIQFGYATLFVVAFPLAPLLAFISNYVEMRVDALKLLDRCCRPEPRGAEDIGTWYPIMEILGIIAVMTNMASVIFSTSNPAFDVTDKLWMVWMFVILEHSVFLLKYCLGKFVPDTPHSVGLQLDRQTYLTEKHMLGEEDDITTAADVRAELGGEAVAEAESKFDATDAIFKVKEEDPFPWPAAAEQQAVTSVTNALYQRGEPESKGSQE